MALNRPTTELDRETFIETLKQEVTVKGYGVVPLIGSGISHGSGIMIGGALGGYLAYVIWRLVGHYDQMQTREDEYIHAMDKGWPSPPSQTELRTVNQWATQWYCELLERHNVHPDMAHSFSINDLYQTLNTQYPLPPVKPLAFDSTLFESWKWSDPLNKMAAARIDIINDAIREMHQERMLLDEEDAFTPRQGVSRTSRRYIVETAVRSLYDWRLALQFLARLKRIDGLYHLTEKADQYVIDSFNIFITQGRKPCLAHQMVSFLTRPLRIRKLLTTNFDTLIEDAYRSIDIPLQIFSIEINSRLPDPDSVSIQKSLIKLHGSLHETRADYSLDTSPDDRDKAVFLEYLWPASPQHPVGLPSHMLVVGTSIPDKRNLELIKYVCDRAPEFRIFVIAHDASTAERIKASFGEEYGEHLIFTYSGNLDLTLYEMYQAFTFSLPPAGFKFEFSQYVPPFEEEHLFFPSGMKVSALRSVRHHAFTKASEFRSTVTGYLYPDKHHSKTKNSVLVIDGPCAITKAGASIFYELKNNQRKNCIWFELEDFSNPYHLLTETFRTISIRLGLYTIENISIEFPCGPATSCSEPCGQPSEQYIDNKLKILIQHFGIDPSGWCLFFYGRNVAGSCAGYQEPAKDSGTTVNDWKQDQFKAFSSILELLANQQFKVIYFPYTAKKYNAQASSELNPAVTRLLKLRKAAALYQNIIKYNNFDTEFVNIKNAVHIDVEANPDFGLMQTTESLMYKFAYAGDSAKTAERLRFIYAATLFRQSRHLSALFSEATLPSRTRYRRFTDIDSGSNADIYSLIQDLHSEHIRFFNRKPGGLAWLFRDTRLLCNTLAERYSPDKLPRNQRVNFASLRTRMHFWIAQWYLRAFYSSNHVDPLKEAIFHIIMSVEHIRYAKLPGANPIKYRESLLSAGLASLAKILMISRESLRYWIAEHRSATAFYWDSIKCALNLSFSLSQLEIEPQSWTPLENYIAERTLKTHFAVDDIPFTTLVFDLLLNIRNECLKLERDILKYSNYYPGIADLASRGRPIKSVPVAGTTARMPRVEIELFFAYIPGDKWEEVFTDDIRHIDTSIQDAIKRMLEIANDHARSPNKEITEAIKQFKYQTTIRFLTSPDNLYVFLQIGSEILYRIIRHAKFNNRCLCIAKLDCGPAFEQTRESIVNGEIYYNWRVREKQEKVDLYWQAVGLFSQALLEMSHNLTPPFLFQENKIKIKLLTFAGLSLGRLGRFSDAHRTLNEGTGIAYNMSLSDSRRELVIVRLRRAEVQILEAIQLGKKLFIATYVRRNRPSRVPIPDTTEFASFYRLHIARLDDAWTVLDEVESMLSSCMHSAFWCGKLYYMRLMIYAEFYVMRNEEGRIMHIPRAFSKVGNAARHLLKTIEQGVLSSGDDEYKKLCFFNVFAKASRKIRWLLTRLDAEHHEARWQLYRMRAIKRILKITQGTPEDENPVGTPDWDQILPPLSNASGNPEVAQFRSGVVNNFKTVFRG